MDKSGRHRKEKSINFLLKNANEMDYTVEKNDCTL